MQAVAAPTCTVRIGNPDDPAGDLTGVRYYAHIVPRIGDTVEMLVQGADRRIVGHVDRAATGRFQRRLLSDGDRSRSGTTWSTFDAALDLDVSARAGDLILYGLSAFAGAATFRTFFTAVTIGLSGSTLNALSGASSFGGLGTATGEGAPGWNAHEGNQPHPFGGAIAYTVTAGDLVVGPAGDKVAMLRLRYRNAASGTRTFAASSARPMMAWACVVPAT